MSAFLGKIHFWLFNKIKYAEQVEAKIARWAEEQEALGHFPASQWKEEIYAKFGEPLGDESLEEIIDTSNIHGWLQDKISKVESRQAAWITYILGANEVHLEQITEIFKDDAQAKGNAARDSYSVSEPEDIYKILNEYILEGMPCDPIDRRMESSDTISSWLTSFCIHEPYWQSAGGDIKYFHKLRNVWNAAFVNALDSRYAYEVEYLEGKKLNKIIKKEK
jgi:hypothetical protein